ncbi:MAG: glycosyltransferase family 4 protein [Candidatus Berkelbacteria bacterium]|nr:glycosyltransferase family 4 protein [Candidatus Berkelbacteria bacterium]
MKIAIDVTRAVVETAGIGRYIRDLTHHLLDLDRENEYIIYSTHFRDSGSKRAIFESFKRKNSTLKRWRLPGLFKEILWTFPVNWLSLMGIKADVHFSTSIFEVGAGFKLPQVLVIYDMTTFLFPQQRGEKISESLNKRTARVCRTACKIICISKSTKRDLYRFVNLPESKAVAIYPGLTGFKKTARVLPSNLKSGEYVLSVGTIEPRKNLEGLFAAFALLDEKIKKSFPLTIVGGKGWRDAKIYEKAKPLEEKGHLKFLGFVSDETLAKLYKETAVFVFTSLYEGFGFPAVEAMSFGRPVICSNISSLPEAGGEAALLVNPKSPDSIARAIQKVLTEEKLRNKMAKLSLAQAKKFDWDKTARQVLEILKSCARKEAA